MASFGQQPLEEEREAAVSQGTRDESPTGFTSQRLELETVSESAGYGMMIEVATIVRIRDMADGPEIRLQQTLGEEDIAPLFDGSVWAGTRLWDAALALTDELLDRFVTNLSGGARVMELGCGLGLPGMVCAALGARAVLSDVPEVLSLLQHNAAVNFGEGNCGRRGGSVHAVALRWDRAEARRLAVLEGGFDFVLCCDCVYEPLYGDSWRPLADCLEVFCGAGEEDQASQHAIAIFSVQRRNHDGVPEFLDRLSQGLDVSLLSSRQPPHGGRIDIFTARRKSDTASPAA